MFTTKVIVKNITSEGRYCLNEIHPHIPEGSIIEGNCNGTSVMFKWHGQDAVLWVGESCLLTKTRRKGLNKWKKNLK